MAKKTSKTTDWQQNATDLLEAYLKKNKATGGSLLVLSGYGELILKTSKGGSVDATTLGSLAASVAAAGEGLGELLKLKGSPIQFGEGKNTFWFDKITDHWMLAGIRCGYQAAQIKSLGAHLKKVLDASQKSGGSEALDGFLNDRIGGRTK